MYNTREAPTAGKDHSPFTIIYWRSYCNSLLCEWRCICQKGDPTLAPLLSVSANDSINNCNTMDHEELKTPPPVNKDSSPSHLTSGATDHCKEPKSNENESA